jgi:hypothetical protein
VSLPPLEICAPDLDAELSENRAAVADAAQDAHVIDGFDAGVRRYDAAVADPAGEGRDPADAHAMSGGGNRAGVDDAAAWIGGPENAVGADADGGRAGEDLAAVNDAT